MKILIGFIGVALSFAACTKSVDTDTSVERPNEINAGQIVTLYVNASNQTKVSSSFRKDGGDTYLDFKWEKGDQIKVSIGENSEIFTLKGEGGSSVGVFEGKMPEGEDNFTIQYPIDPVDLSSQTYKEGSVPEGKCAFVAENCSLTGSQIELKQANSILALPLKGTKSVSKINVYKLGSSNTDYTKYTLSAENVVLDSSTPKYFYVIVPSAKFKVLIEVFDSENKCVGSWQTSNELDFATDGSFSMNMTDKDVVAEVAPVYSEGGNTLPSVKIGGVWWAPVNCGYDKDNYKFGKLYQFGRMDGCGYAKTTSISSKSVSGKQRIPQYSQSTAENQIQSFQSRDGGHMDNPAPSYFYLCKGDYGDWYAKYYSEISKIITCWPHSSSETPSGSTRIGNPCPAGWRVPKLSELKSLLSSYTDLTFYLSNGTIGAWFDGTSSPGENTNGVFLPAAGRRYINGSSDVTEERGMYGYYWTSETSSSEAKYIRFYCHNRNNNFSTGASTTSSATRHSGYSVRCVHD